MHGPVGDPLFWTQREKLRRGETSYVGGRDQFVFHLVVGGDPLTAENFQPQMDKSGTVALGLVQ